LGTDALAQPFEVASIGVGDSHACAVSTSGSLKCWGANALGSLGLGDTSARGDAAGEMGDDLPIVPVGAVAAVGGGSGFTCARNTAGKVKCWGGNANGELGLVPSSPIGDQPAEAIPYVFLQSPNGNDFPLTKLYVGFGHSCALTASGTLRCWGDNGDGEDGTDTSGAYKLADSSVPLVPLSTPTADVALVPGRTCALSTTNQVRCWGYIGWVLPPPPTQQIGNDPGEIEALVPLTFNGLVPNALSGAWGAHFCAVGTAGNGVCWGRNDDGELGLGDTTLRSSPASVPPLDLGAGALIAQIVGGQSHTCALLVDGRVKCWGANDVGQLGLGDDLPRGDGPGEMGDNLPPVPLP